MRIAILIVAVFLCGAWGRVSERFAFNSESENGIVLYASITNVDLIIRQVDLERLQTISGPIMLPATHRFNADVVRGELGALGFKELPPGFYAIVDARTDLSAQIGGGGTSGGCQDHSALVFEVRRGQIRVLPRALYRLTDNRAQGRTGLGEEQSDLNSATAILERYQNISAEVQLAQPVARIRFAARNSRDIFRESCASADAFEVLSPDEPNTALPAKE